MKEVVILSKEEFDWLERHITRRGLIGIFLLGVLTGVGCLSIIIGVVSFLGV